jgi:y4mF family transcriptional regulator
MILKKVATVCTDQKPGLYLLKGRRGKQIYPSGYAIEVAALKYTLSGINYRINVDFIPVRVYYYTMENISMFVRRKRKEAGLTQEDFAVRTGLGLRFVRELEEGKSTVRLDKVNQALSLFGYEAGPVPQERIK